MAITRLSLAATRTVLAQAKDIWTQLSTALSSPLQSQVAHLQQVNSLISQLNPKLHDIAISVNRVTFNLAWPGGSPPPDPWDSVQSGFWWLMKAIGDFAAKTGRIRISYGKEFETTVWGAETMTLTYPYPITEATLTMGQAQVGPTMTQGDPGLKSFPTGGFR
jgi:hypothetical protein